MSDRQIEIEINSKQTGSGFKGAEADMAKLKAQIADLQKQTAALDAENKKLNNSLAEVGKKHEDLDEPIKKHAANNTRLALGSVFLDRVTHQLGQRFPWLGSMIGAVFIPVSVAVIAFEKCKKAISEWNKELDESAKRLAEPLWRDEIDKRREALTKFQADMAKTMFEYQHLITKENELKIAYDLGTDAINDRAAALARLANADKSGKEISIAERQARGKITPEQATIERVNLEREEKEKAERAEKLKLENDIDRVRGEFVSVTDRTGDLTGKYQTAAKKAADDKKHADDLNANYSKAKEREKDLAPEGAAAIEGLENMRKYEDITSRGLRGKASMSENWWAEKFIGSNPFMLNTDYRDKKRSEWESAKSAWDQNRALMGPGKTAEIGMAVRVAGQSETVAGQAKKELDDNAKRAEELKNSVNKLTEKLDALLSTPNKNASAQEGKNIAAKGIETLESGGGIGAEVAKQVMSASDLAKKEFGSKEMGRGGENLTPEQKEYLRGVGSMIAGREVALPQATNLMNMQHGDVERLFAIIRRIVTVMETRQKPGTDDKMVQEFMVNVEMRMQNIENKIPSN